MRLLRALPTVFILLSIAAIGVARPRLAAIAGAAKARSDVFALPPRRTLKAVSLGYSAAFADLIWAHVLVTQGLRHGEGRPFEHLEQYLGAVNELDPTFREPYRLAGSLLIYQRNDPHPEQSARVARQVMETGLQNFPHDARLWMDYGEFLAYVAPPILQSSDEKARWRVEGARALVRAGELGSKDQNVYWHAISAVGILNKEGEREAMLHFLERVLATTEDEELKRFIEPRLKILQQGRRDSRTTAFNGKFEELWRSSTPFATRTQRRIIGPAVSSWICAGAHGDQADSCSRDWNAWARSVLPDFPSSRGQ